MSVHSDQPLQPDRSLVSLGWTPELTSHLAAHLTATPPQNNQPQNNQPQNNQLELVPARVILHGRAGWTVSGPAGELLADLLGRFRRGTPSHDLPAVGDWVLISPRPGERRATIHVVLPRHSALLRKVAGITTEAQVVAANVDTVLVTVPLDVAPNPRLLERQLTVAWESGAVPVVVGTKTDRVGGNDALGTVDDVLEQLRAIAIGAEVIAISSATGDGIEQLDPWLAPGRTLVLLGPSGAGKSTLANRLVGEDRMATGGVRLSDSKGRHTTSHRELVVLPGGALLIDTPGLRELALWDADEGVTSTFTDVEEIAEQCHFNNCAHGNEPGCAVRIAMADGSLDPGRFASWEKLQRELAHLAVQKDALLKLQDRKKWSSITRAAKKRARP